MSAEWVTAVGTVGTFLVIAASAIAALVQLRHTRGSNQIIALTEIRETIESPDFREAQHFVSYELPKRLTDPKEVLRIAQPQSQFEAEYKAIDTVANFFENIGVFVKNRIIDERLACDMWSYVILRNWHALAPIVVFVRQDLHEPRIWENFEYLAVMCEKYTRRHPNGEFPAGARRMPENDTFVKAVERARSGV